MKIGDLVVVDGLFTGTLVGTCGYTTYDHTRGEYIANGWVVQLPDNMKNYLESDDPTHPRIFIDKVVVHHDSIVLASRITAPLVQK